MKIHNSRRSKLNLLNSRPNLSHDVHLSALPHGYRRISYIPLKWHQTCQLCGKEDKYVSLLLYSSQCFTINFRWHTPGTMQNPVFPCLLSQTFKLQCRSCTGDIAIFKLEICGLLPEKSVIVLKMLYDAMLMCLDLPLQPHLWKRTISDPLCDRNLTVVRCKERYRSHVSAHSNWALFLAFNG